MVCRILWMFVSLMFLCGCVSGRNVFSPGFFSGIADPVELIPQVEQMMAQRKYRVLDRTQYREIFSTEQDWSAGGNLVPLDLEFLPSDEQHVYRMRGYLLDALQREKELILFEVRGKIPAEEEGLLLVSLSRKQDPEGVPVFLPRTKVLNQLRNSFRQLLKSGKVRWDKIPKDMPQWSDARFQEKHQRMTLQEEDLILFGIRQNADAVEFLYNVPGQTVSAGGYAVILENLHVFLASDGKVLSMRTELSRQTAGYETFSELTVEDRRKITAKLLHALAEMKLPEKVREKEKFRFAAVTGVSFGNIAPYLKKGKLPFRNVFERNWQINLPFNEGRHCYTAYQNGAFYYLVQDILPVSGSKAVVQGFLTWGDGKANSAGLILFLEKHLSVWKISGEWMIHFR